MNRNFNKWLSKGLLALLAVCGFTSCTDDHFDIDTTTTAQGSLWDKMVATGKCNDFAKILSKTIVDRKDYGTPATLTYEDLLKSNKVMTIWAPEDGTYDAQKWLDMLGDGSSVKANENVESQFVANHIAYFNYNGSYPVNQRILLANGKFTNYNAADNSFNDVSISDKFTNVPAANGTLHVLTAPAPFKPNLRQILLQYPELSSLYNYVESRDTVEFIESLSTPGTTIDGIVHYVDSFFRSYNKVYPSIAANEDSLCAAIFPSNQAWEEALNTIGKYYNYKKTYAYYTSKEATKPTLDTLKADSVREARTVQAIFNNMFYSLYEQPAFDVNSASVETVGNFFRTCDSLMSTAYYSTSNLRHQYAPQCWELAEGKDPIESSNGYAFITDHFNFKPSRSWQYDIELEAENSWYINDRNTSTVLAANPTGSNNKVTENTQNPAVTGKLGGNAYRQFLPNGPTSKIKVCYNLPNILSGVYDVYVVMVPENIIDTTITTPKNVRFTATLYADFDNQAKPTKTTTIDGVTYPTQWTCQEQIANANGQIDTVLLFKDIKFPYAYYGLPGAKPYITLSSTYKTTWKNKTTNAFYIDKFILKAKDPDEE